MEGPILDPDGNEVFARRRGVDGLNWSVLDGEGTRTLVVSRIRDGLDYILEGFDPLRIVEGDEPCEVRLIASVVGRVWSARYFEESGEGGRSCYVGEVAEITIRVEVPEPYPPPAPFHGRKEQSPPESIPEDQCIPAEEAGLSFGILGWVVGEALGHPTATSYPLRTYLEEYCKDPGFCPHGG